MSGKGQKSATRSPRTQTVSVGGVDLTEYLEWCSKFESMAPMERFLVGETSRMEQLAISNLSEEKRDESDQTPNGEQRS